MPSWINDRIAELIVDLEWFSSQTLDTSSLPSDNWRYVQDMEGRTTILYVMFFHNTSTEPNPIPNESEAIPKLFEFRQSLHLLFGPFLALAEISTEKKGERKININSLRLWDISSRISPDVSGWSIAEMSTPIRSFPTVR